MLIQYLCLNLKWNHKWNHIFPYRSKCGTKMWFQSTIKEIFLFLLNKAKFVTLQFCNSKNNSLEPHMEPHSVYRYKCGSICGSNRFFVISYLIS